MSNKLLGGATFVIICVVAVVAFQQGILSLDSQALRKLLHLAPEPPPVAASTPTPTPTPKKRLAAEGTYYLLQRLSIVSESGVYGLSPGTKLNLIERNPNRTLRLSDGNQEIDIVPDALTNDLDLADLAKRNDTESQARIRLIQAHEKAIADKREAAEAARKERDQLQTDSASVRSRSVAAAAEPPRNPLDRGAYNHHTSRPYYYSYSTSSPYAYSYGRPYARVYYYDQWGKRYFISPDGAWNYY